MVSLRIVGVLFARARVGRAFGVEVEADAGAPDVRVVGCAFGASGNAGAAIQDDRDFTFRAHDAILVRKARHEWVGRADGRTFARVVVANVEALGDAVL